jgi:hypothetical protein
MPGWFYYPDRGKGKSPVGPIALEELVRRIKAHSLAETTIVFPEGTDYAYDAYTFPRVAHRLPLALHELTRAWVRGSSRPKWPERDWWAWRKACRLVHQEPARGWRVICALVAKARSRDVLGNIGALLLEDLLDEHPAYRTRVLRRAQRNTKFRSCLGYVRESKLTGPMRRLVQKSARRRRTSG